MVEIREELLCRLRCPQSRAKVVLAGEWLYSTDPNTRRKYPIRDGIPVMLVEESAIADQDEFDRIMASAAGGAPDS